jgi:hypothetical protein
MKPSGAHTHPGSGSGIGTAALVVLAAVIVAAIAGPVVRAVTDLIEALVLVVAVVIRLRRGAFPALRLRTLPAARPVPTARTVRVIPADGDRAPLTAPAAPEVHTHIHVHLGGQSAEADAAAVRALTERAG